MVRDRLWNRDGLKMTTESKLLGVNPVSGDVLPEAVSFDGTNDFLSRTTNLTGNGDTNQFTCSFWVYKATGSTDCMVYLVNNTGQANKFEIYLGAYWQLKGRDSGGSTRLDAYTSGGETGVPADTWVNVVMSINLSDSSKRFIYVNDINITSNFTFDAYSGTINTNPSTSLFRVGSASNTSGRSKGRLANFFLDYDYLDISVTANRRLFLTADNKPADDQTDLNPIIYLPMAKEATAGYNSGTGGDFTVNGIMATAQRGPNQDNCSASDFNGSDDYLQRSLGSAITDSKQCTVSFCITHNTAFTYSPCVSIFEYGVNSIRTNAAGLLSISFWKTSPDVTVASADLRTLVVGRFYHIVFSFDLADTSKRHVYINGEEETVTWNNYVDLPIDFTRSYMRIGRATGQNYWDGDIGEYYLDTNYIDLATENPFWNSDTNLPNSVRKVIEDTGVTPVVALPIVGVDAGNNLGTGGDYTVYSGPFTGVRGGSEFSSRSAKGNGSNGYLLNSSISGISDGKTISMVRVFQYNMASNYDFEATLSDNNQAFYFGYNNNQVHANVMDGDGVGPPLDVHKAFTPLAFGDWFIVFLSADLSDVNKRFYSLNGNTSAVTWNNYSNQNINYSDTTKASFMARTNGQYPSTTAPSMFYLTTDYIDFSQEANRNKFISQLGYPIDLTKQIEDGDIPNPLIYMKFESASTFGINGGTVGNFTVNGTVTEGPDFSGAAVV